MAYATYARQIIESEHYQPSRFYTHPFKYTLVRGLKYVLRENQQQYTEILSESEPFYFKEFSLGA